MRAFCTVILSEAKDPACEVWITLQTRLLHLPRVLAVLGMTNARLSDSPNRCAQD